MPRRPPALALCSVHPDGTTCVTHRRRVDGGCDAITMRGYRETGRHTLSTAPAHDDILGTAVGAEDVRLATGRGLSHGRAGRTSDERKK